MAPPTSDRTLEWEGGALADLVSALQASALPTRIEVIPPGPVGSSAGEVHLIAGGLADAFAGSLRRDDAMAALQRVEGARFLVECRLPDPESGTLTPAGPDAGSLKDRPLAALMRYCEDYVLTCRVEIERGPERAEVNYNRGELVGTTSDGKEADDRLPAMLAWTDGAYRIILPSPVLPPGRERRRDSQLLPRAAEAGKPERKRYPTLPGAAGAVRPAGATAPTPPKTAGAPGPEVTAPFAPAPLVPSPAASQQKPTTVPPISSLRLSPAPDLAAPARRPTLPTLAKAAPPQAPIPPEGTKRGIPGVLPSTQPATITARGPGVAASVPKADAPAAPVLAARSAAGAPLSTAAKPEQGRPAAPLVPARPPTGAAAGKVAAPSLAVQKPAPPAVTAPPAASASLKPAAPPSPAKPAPATTLAKPAAATSPRPATTAAPAGAAPSPRPAAPAAAPIASPASLKSAAPIASPASLRSAAPATAPATVPASLKPAAPQKPAPPTAAATASTAQKPVTTPSPSKPAARAPAPGPSPAKPAAPASLAPPKQKEVPTAAKSADPPRDERPASTSQGAPAEPAGVPETPKAETLRMGVGSPAAPAADNPPPAAAAKPPAAKPAAAKPAAAKPAAAKPAAASNDLKPASGTIQARPRPSSRPRLAAPPVEVAPEPAPQFHAVTPASVTPQLVTPRRPRTSARKRPPEQPVLVYVLTGLAIGVGIVLAYWLYFSAHLGR